MASNKNGVAGLTVSGQESPAKKSENGHSAGAIGEVPNIQRSAANAGPYSNQELYEKNLNFIETRLGKISDAIAKFPMRGQLLQTEDGDFNVRYSDNSFMYKEGAKKSSAQQLAQWMKSPPRITYAPPEKLFESDPSKNTLAPEHERWLTRRYDDINFDAHAEAWAKDVSKAVADFGLDYQKDVTSKRPYYVVAFGIGLGTYIFDVVKTFQPKSIILCEHDLESFIHSMHVTDWKEIFDYCEGGDKNLKLLIEPSAANLLHKLNGAIQTECLLGLDALVYLVHRITPTLQPVVNDFASSKTANLASFIGFTADEFNMMKNSFRNLRSGTKRVLGKVRQKARLPVVIVGSGPSLEENIDWIKSNRDKIILVSSGSSMNVLLKHGMQPDIQCVLERAKAVFDRHQEASKDYDLKKTRVVLTSTIWPGIDEFFKDVVYFFRPALTPLSVFMLDSTEILNGEGPQVTNTAFAFTTRLEPSEVYLVGIDLGAKDPKKPRAEKAWISPNVPQRELTLPVRGNHGETVFTDRNLQHQKQTIELQIQAISKRTKVFNLSGGVYIKGAEPRFSKDVTLQTSGKIDHEKHLEDLFAQFAVYTRERFINAWETAGVRENIAEYMRQCRKVLDEETEWSPNLLLQLDKINSYLNKGWKKQYAPRLCRGSFLRILIYLNAIYVRLKDPSRHGDFYKIAKELLLKFLGQLENEAYSLADELEQEDDTFRPIKLT